MKYNVLNMETGRSYTIESSHIVSLDIVWRSECNWFMPGSRVQISDENGNTKQFIR